MSCNPFGNKYVPQWGDDRSTIVVSDSPSTKYIGDNPDKKHFSLFRVDGHIISSANKLKCDYLLIRCADSHCFFIELKGSDLAHASNQILESIKQLKASLTGHVLNARIVLTKTPSPSLRSSSYLKLKQVIEDKEGTLMQKSVQLREPH